MDGTLKKKLSPVFISLFSALSLCAVLSLSSCGKGGVDGDSSTSFPITEAPGTDADMPKDPNDASRAVGFYTNGSVTSSFQLPDSSSSYVKIFRLRDRAYATRTMIQTIVNGTAAWRRLFPVGDRAQVADIGKKLGGEASGHASHRNGLDVDIAYLQTNHVERNPNTNGPNGFAESFVKSGKVTPNFDIQRNWFLLKSMVAQGNVNRIFVDPIIKKTFCAQAATLDPTATVAVRNETLRRLRPYTGHDDHFHMRINCPANALKCIAQEPVAAGSGCSSVSETSTDEDSDEQGEDIF